MFFKNFQFPQGGGNKRSGIIVPEFVQQVLRKGTGINPDPDRDFGLPGGFDNLGHFPGFAYAAAR